MDYLWLLFPTLFYTAAVNAAPTVPQALTAEEGGNVTFWEGLTNQTQATFSSGNSTLLRVDSGSIEIMKDNVRVENGAILMTNVQKNDSNVVYKLQIYNGHRGTTYTIQLNVTDVSCVQPTHHLNPQKTKGGQQYAFFSFCLIPLAFVFFAMYRKRSKCAGKACHLNNKI